MIKKLVKLWCIFEAFNEMCWLSILVVEENAIDDMCLYYMFLDDVDYLVWDLYYTLPIKANHAHLPCMQAYSLCSFHSMRLLHKHLRTCIIQDRKPRARSSYPRSPRSSSRCSHKKWPKQTRRTLRNFRSAPITARAPSREASPGAFFSLVCDY